MLFCDYGHVAFPKHLVVPWDCVVRLLGGAALTRVGDDAAFPECFDPPPAWIPCQGVISCIPQSLAVTVNSKPPSSDSARRPWSSPRQSHQGSGTLWKVGRPSPCARPFPVSS